MSKNMITGIRAVETWEEDYLEQSHDYKINYVTHHDGSVTAKTSVDGHPFDANAATMGKATKLLTQKVDKAIDDGVTVHPKGYIS